ncbi:probable U3 small nucleolar RNA-associated protein 21 [Saccharomycodes ludwigii]|uniref:Probable U3 small nucleolar RNA-associated protein 21 n=1 Tax=Saccharomycodes ludwigii TaxID=36035 RepID=A0A376B4L3_9ASCO|nr:probable U3 small nucleolar RNA-associated protein 21 [Saccharomycodes ludwigii]
MTQEQSTKKRKIVSQQLTSHSSKHASKIFSPFRVIGNVTNNTPFSIGTLGSTFYIVTSVGKSFQIYDANNLHLLFVSEGETESFITCLHAHYHHVYVSFSNKIGIYKRGRQESLIEIEQIKNKRDKINNLLVFGDYLIASTSESQNVFVYRKNNKSNESNTVNINYSFYTSLKGNIVSDIVSLIHLPTYLNKIVVVTKKNMLLFNIRTGRLLFTSEEFPSEITSAEAAPVLDVLGLTTSNGEVILYNIRQGRVLRNFRPHGSSRITSLSFRTDGSSHISVGYANGDLVFYDLNRHSRIHVISSVHKEINGGVSKSCFLNGQPIIVTAGGDNQLKEYVFDPSLSIDQDDEESTVVQPPRLLRSRGGHSKPPTKVIFVDKDAHYLLSASQDQSIWAFSLRKDAQSQELSQRPTTKGKKSKLHGKLPSVTDLAIELTRAGDWDNIVTSHEGSERAYSWNSKTKRLGSHIFETTDGGFVSCVSISSCGNFSFIGSSKGGIAVYNLQSGKLRKKFNLHKQSVTGICVDSMNRKMVSVGLDGIVGFYDFAKSKYLGKLELDSPITQMKHHKTSDLFALALDDLSVVVLDALTQKVVRQFYGHDNRITSFDFSPDGRWIVSASLDSTIRTWDLPTGGCIDGVKVDSVATNIVFSPNGEYLATSHVNGNGISIWTNRAQFKPISTCQIEEEDFVRIMSPTSTSDGGVTMLDGAFDDEDENQDSEYYDNYTSVEQIDRSLITLSIGPRSKMNTLVNLETIKRRSKPVEPPKKPEKAPFFLQLTGSAVGDDASNREGVAADTTAQEQLVSQNSSTHTINEANLGTFKPTGRIGFESKFTNLLRTNAETSNYTEFLGYLLSLSPSSVDLEIRSLNCFEPYDELIWFIEALTFCLKTNKDYDLAEAFMAMLLKVHGDVIHTHREIKPALVEWNNTHNGKQENLDDLVKFCSSILNFVNTSM